MLAIVLMPYVVLLWTLPVLALFFVTSDFLDMYSFKTNVLLSIKINDNQIYMKVVSTKQKADNETVGADMDEE